MLAAEPMVGSLTTITSAHLAQFADDAEALIDGRIVRNYNVNFSSAPIQLVALATDLALYNVLAKRIFTQERLQQSGCVDRFKESMLEVQKVADGSSILTTSSGDIIAARTEVAELDSNTRTYLQTFHEGPIGSEVQDKDKIDDLLSDREL